MNILRSFIAGIVFFTNSGFLYPQATGDLAGRIQAVMSRPEFAHSSFAIEFYSLDAKKVLYQFQSDRLMVPGSTTKLLTEGTILELLGGDYRFHTRVYRTGEIKKGALEHPAASRSSVAWLIAATDLRLER